MPTILPAQVPSSPFSHLSLPIKLLSNTLPFPQSQLALNSPTDPYSTQHLNYGVIFPLNSTHLQFLHQHHRSTTNLCLRLFSTPKYNLNFSRFPTLIHPILCFPSSHPQQNLHWQLLCLLSMCLSVSLRVSVSLWVL